MNRCIKPLFGSAARLFLLALLLPGVASANGLFRFEVDVGGDELAYATFNNGSTENIKAGQGLYISLGQRLKLQSNNLSLDMTIGYKFDSVTADNGDLYWSTFPLEVILHNQMRQLHFGMGLAAHLNPRLEGTGAASFLSQSFDASMGLILEGGLAIFNNNNLGVRYTSISYRAPGIEADGSHLGLFWQTEF